MRLLDIARARGPAAHGPDCGLKGGPGRLRIEDGRVTGAGLFAEMEGFAAVAGATGGLGRRLFTVTNAQDRDPREGAPPAGSLRAAIEAARADGGGWILFDASAFDAPARVDLATILRMPSNVTLDAGCADVTLTAPSRDTILHIRPPNVIVYGFAFEKRGEARKEDGGDCVTVGNTFDRVYIAHNDFGFCADGQIDVTSMRAAGGGRITIAYNRFERHDKSMIVGSLDCYAPNGRRECDEAFADPAAWRPEIYATLIGNVFAGTNQRHPRVSGRAFVHLQENLVLYAYYGAFVGSGGRALIERSLFANVSNRPGRERLAVWTTETPGAPNMPTDSAGALALRDVVSLAARPLREERAALVPPPPYRRRDPVDPRSSGPEKFAACVVARAGRFGAARWPAECR